jgi:O-antigen ligase
VWGFAISRRPGATVSARVMAIAYLLAIGAVSVTWMGASTIATRFSDVDTTDAARLLAWRDAVRVVKAFPLTGTGVNAYDAALLSYDSHMTEKFFGQVHNDYIQVAAEGGLLVGLPAIAVVLAFVRAVRRRSRLDDIPGGWLRFGAVTGLIAIALQEAVDFSLQIPGNTVLFAAVAAIALHNPSHRRPAPRTMA